MKVYRTLKTLFIAPLTVILRVFCALHVHLANRETVQQNKCPEGGKEQSIMTTFKTVKVGTMPGRINEFSVQEGASIASVLELAGLNATGFEVKVDSISVTDLQGTVVTSSTNLILLAKQVKGNAGGVVKIGTMPGRINEFALPPETTIAQALETAELNPSGFEVKVDSVRVTDFNTPIGDANLILLAKQVKGNNDPDSSGQDDFDNTFITDFGSN